MTPLFLLGIAASLVLVLGAALPDTTVKHAVQSRKDWCFLLGGAGILLYAILNWMNGAPIFFVFLEGVVMFASVLMMLDVPEDVSDPLVIFATLGLVLWSLILFSGFGTVVFVLGLGGIALGYVMQPATPRRELTLCVGSLLIAYFSWVSGAWVFFWLNAFFALFSAWNFYLVEHLPHEKKRHRYHPKAWRKRKAKKPRKRGV